jgi:UDP-N-acetylglucosamine:LPS N-acetylglucosamine transferase
VLEEDISPSTRTQLLVSCGSQGSSTIFDTLLGILASGDFHCRNFDIHLVLGTKNSQFREKFAAFENVKIYDFFYNQKEYFRVVRSCDIVISRSGSSIFEFEALGLHMILIPHPHTGNNHQYYNAKIFEKK